MEIKIESGVPMPSIRNDMAAVLVAMKAGDSFVLPVKQRQTISLVAKKADIKIATASWATSRRFACGE